MSGWRRSRNPRYCCVFTRSVLKCLDKYCKDKAPGKDTTCPLCRKVFSVPAGGNKNLPNNYFMEQLIQVNKSTNASREGELAKPMSCELCSDTGVKIPASSYCIECDQHICDRCSGIHNKSKTSRSHQVVLSVDIPSAEDQIKLAVTYCDLHPGEQNRFYCYDCKMVICCKCFVDKDPDHKLIDVNKSAEKF